MAEKNKIQVTLQNGPEIIKVEIEEGSKVQALMENNKLVGALVRVNGAVVDPRKTTLKDGDMATVVPQSGKLG